MNTLRVVTLAPLLAFALAAAPPRPADQPKTRAFAVEGKPEEVLSKPVGLKQRYALLIGISKYANPALTLNFAAADAQSLHKLLTDPEVGAYKPENVRLLVDEQATRKNIVSALGTWLNNRVTADDSVLIFYSGHGALGNASEAYWVTYDADPEDLAASAISNKEISNAIANLPCKRKITLIDSCFSEATAKRYRALVPNNLFDQFKGTGVVTITASTGQQKSVEVGGHGAFTYHLLDALQGKADNNQNGVVELDEVWTYLNDRVQKTAADAGNKQTPVLMAERMEHGFPVTVNPGASAAPLVAQLKSFYADGQISLEEMTEAERVLMQRQGNAELRGLYKGLAEKAITIQYFRTLKSVVAGGGGAAAPGAPAAPVAAAPGAAPAAGATGAELEAFRVAEAAASFDAWLRYLQQFPQGYLSGAARTRLEELDKKKSEEAAYTLARRADNEKTWEQLAQLYPGSSRANEAERRASEMKQKREAEMSAFRLAESKNIESAWERFLKEFPTGQLALLAEDRLETMKRISREKEDAAYARAVRAATVAEWDRYITEYPTGRFIADATAKKAEVVKKIEEERARQAELDLYNSAAGADTLESWGAYVARYAAGPHTAEAKKRIEQLTWVAFAGVAPVKGGLFTMGSDANKDEKPPHKVEVDGFLIMKGEVTNAQYAKFMAEAKYRAPADPSFQKGYFAGHPDLPVVNVTYDDALAFCKWLSEKTGAKVRLPTEAEWEFAAAGGKDGMLYPWGSEKPKLKARYKDNAGSGAKTAALKMYQPNGFGLYHMSGNVSEWVSDYYGEQYYRGAPTRNPPGPGAGKERVVRGGSWKSGEGDVRVASRGKQVPTQPSDTTGFRVLIEAAKK